MAAASAWYGTPSTVTSTPDHADAGAAQSEGFGGMEAPWAPYAFYDASDPLSGGYDWGAGGQWGAGQWNPELQYAGMGEGDVFGSLDFTASSTPSAAMMEILQRRVPSKTAREKEKKKPKAKSPAAANGKPSQLSNPSRPRLQELRNLPQRGLGLQWMKDERKFQVVELQSTTMCESPGPAATVLRPEEGNAVLDGTDGLPALDNLQGSVVCWTVQAWVARRYEATPSQQGGAEWVETECVQLEPGELGMEQEWARRFSQREKQLLVGKGTRGYRRFLRDIPKTSRKSGDPATPRVAEQCSKRAFDGRLKQWRILLHAFSPRESEDEAEPDRGKRSPMKAPETPMDAARRRRVPPTPPKPASFDSATAGSTPLASPNAASDFSTPLLPGSQASAQAVDSMNSMAFTLPFPSPLSPFPADYTGVGADDFTPSHLPGHLPAHFQMPGLGPNGEQLGQMAGLDWHGELGNLLTKLSLAQHEGAAASLDEVDAPSPSSSPEPGALAELLPTWLLDEERLDLDAVLAKAQVTDELVPLFKDNFAAIGEAWRLPHDEREELLTASSRSVLAAINTAEPKVEATPLEVLDMLFRFANELRLLFARAK